MIGIAHNKGNAITHYVLDDATGLGFVQSELCSEEQTNKVNQCTNMEQTEDKYDPTSIYPLSPLQS
jgi:hypothetical protein